MTRATFSTLVAVLASASWPLVPAAAQQPLRTALIISNSQYANLPPLERCPSSAALVRDALRGKGFEVVERSDLKRGEFDAAIGALARRAAASPPAFAALYYCGYAIEFNGRSFLLPTSANISREDDVLTQGVISKSLVDSLARVGDSSGFVMLDGFARPGTAATGLARLVEQIAPARYAVIGVSNEGPGQGPTMASQAVRDQVAGSEISLETFVAGLRRQLAKETAVFVPATGPAAFLAGGRPPAPPAPTPPPTPPPTPVAAQPATPVPPPVAPPPAAAPPTRQITMVDEEQMSDQDRRQIQVALATMGYYSGRIDATFGPETRAAIRRFQFEIKAELTGRLTGEQATKLVNSGR